MCEIKYDKPIEYKGQVMTDKYIASLNKEEREALIEPLTDIFYEMGYRYPDDYKKIDKEWNRIIKYDPDINVDSIFNNDSVGTYVTKFFCKDFYNSSGAKSNNTLISIFEDRENVRKIIYNRLGLKWYDECPGTDGTFSLSPKMVFFQGPRSMRLVNQQSIYKPIVHKYLVKKYTNPGDVVFDYSCGWGARMLATASFGDRKYIGTDPLTVPDLTKMKNYLKLDNIELIQSGSEDYRGEENSVDFAASSPPYFNQEIYSKDSSQAYNKGEDYFYDIYWKKTLENSRYMLKPGKVFGLNVTNYPKMLDMAREVFGEEKEKVALRLIRSHLSRKAGLDKNEYVYIFRNDK